MPIEDIHELVEVLEKAGELKKISTEVNSELELAEILRRTMYDNGPALLFENVKGYDMPVLGNAFGSMKRLELSLETSDFTEIGQRIADMTKMEIPKGMLNKIKKLPELSMMSESFPSLENPQVNYWIYDHLIDQNGNCSKKPSGNGKRIKSNPG